MRPLYIFDLDGTLALIDHRRHFVADRKNQRWDDFYRACVDDKPNAQVITLYLWLIPNADTYIFSGRSNSVRTETEAWLLTYRCLPDLLKMRRQGDNTPDEILKKRWYEELPSCDKGRLVCIFDDRQKVVDMWRSLGLTCLQVAKGDF